MIRNTTKRQKLGWVIFIGYLVFLAYFLFFSEDFGRTRIDYGYNLVPLREIRRFFLYSHIVGVQAFFLNIVGNVVGFMPFGFFLPVISRRSRLWYNTVLLSFLFSLSIETIQLVFRVGSFDVDDMILNTLGGILGFVCYKIVQRIRKRRRMGAKA